MKIFRAIGLGLMIVILKLLMPDVFAAFQSTLIAFFGTLQKILSIAPTDVLQHNTVAFPKIPVVQGYPDYQGY